MSAFIVPFLDPSSHCEKAYGLIAVFEGVYAHPFLFSSLLFWNPSFSQNPFLVCAYSLVYNYTVPSSRIFALPYLCLLSLCISADLSTSCSIYCCCLFLVLPLT